MMFKARILVPKGTKRSYKPPTFHFFSPTQPPTFFYLSAVTKKFFKDLVQESACYNMYINAQKSKIMVVSRQDNISVQVDHEGESLEQVHDFK